ncbi:MAG: DUF5060 domain-containing protein [Verrucomicrobiota bacterium]
MKRRGMIVGMVALFAWQAGAAVVEQFGREVVAFTARGTYANPYTECSAEAVLTEPDGKTTRTIPLFWDGGTQWKLRVSPDKVGTWKWNVRSADAGLNAQRGSFDCVASARPGSIRPMTGAPLHFERQNGERFWFMGDTAWALFTDSAQEKHDRATAHAYLDARAAQGFNVVHSMLMAESGWGNPGGLPFTDISAEKINPGYWQEVDQRLAYANAKGLVVGLALAWGDKRKVEPFAWRRLPNLEARQRYARYIAARYGAYDVYFIVSGEWHGEVRTRGSDDETIRKEFIAIGDALKAADAHGRMAAIHPMTREGSVREFNAAAWMSFGDYQQNYRDLHARLLQSRTFNKPVVNSEYGYHLRDQSGDGVPDKDNSTSLEAIRHATWDIVMAGGYAVTGFGTTYFGGNRDPGPFDLHAQKNTAWEQQFGHIKRLFTSLDWWKLVPHDELVSCATKRGGDTQELKQVAPPKTTYWCLAEPGRVYMIYARGVTEPLLVDVKEASLKASLFNPRTGETTAATVERREGKLQIKLPDAEDWVVLIR